MTVQVLFLRQSRDDVLAAGELVDASGPHLLIALSLRNIYRCREKTQMVYCELPIPAAQNKRSTGGRYNNG
jgi:hypothetical protein